MDILAKLEQTTVKYTDPSGNVITVYLHEQMLKIFQEAAEEIRDLRYRLSNYRKG